MKNVYLGDTEAPRLPFASTRYGSTSCRCAQCGYSIDVEDAAVMITATGDTIHRDCWEEYAADNAEEFLEALTF